MKTRRALRTATVPAIALTALTALGCSDVPASEAERELTEAVDRFLRVAGRYDLDSLPLLFTEDANIGSTVRRDGVWVTSTMTFDAWLESLRARTDARPYTEPVSEFTVHVDNDQLAFVRADATLMRDGQAQSHNIDYFTLIRDDGIWKILSASYTIVPDDAP